MLSADRVCSILRSTSLHLAQWQPYPPRTYHGMLLSPSPELQVLDAFGTDASVVALMLRRSMHSTNQITPAHLQESRR